MVALLALLTAQAADPVVTWSVPPSPYPVHFAAPASRSLKFSCADADGDDPLSHRCQVWDVTAGGLGSGSEVQIAEDDCGQSNGPSSVTHTFAVPSPVAAHRYLFVAACTDATAASGRATQTGV